MKIARKRKLKAEIKQKRGREREKCLRAVSNVQSRIDRRCETTGNDLSRVRCHDYAMIFRMKFNYTLHRKYKIIDTVDDGNTERSVNCYRYKVNDQVNIIIIIRQ